MSATDLATQLGVSVSMVSRLRSGQRRPSLSLILKIRDALNWPVEEQAMVLAESTTAYGFEFSRRADGRT